MKRLFALSSFAWLFCASPGCKQTARIDPIKLIPEGATMIGGVDVQSVVASKPYQDNQAMIEQGEGKAGLEAARACNVGPETWKQLLVGLDSAAPEFKMVLVIEATGLGERTNLDCLASKIQAREGAAPWTMEEKDGRLTLSLAKGGATAYVIDPNTVAVVGSEWTSAVELLLAGRDGASSAVDGSLKGLMGRVKKDQIWLAGTIPSGMAQPPVDGAENATVALNVADGLAVRAAVGFGSAADAATKADALKAQYAQLKPVISSAGIPPGILEGVTIAAEEATVVVALKASATDMDALSKRAASLVGGLQ